MSTEQTNNRSRPASGRGSLRKRRPPSGTRGPRGPRTTKSAEDNQKGGAENPSSSTVQKKERPPSYSWPAENLGKELTGTVVSVIRRGKYNFGFISLSTGDDFHDEKYPRIYFNPSHVGETGLYLRTGYQVRFTATNDEEGRSVATSITLTEAGSKIKEEREEQIAKKRAERQQQIQDGTAEERPRGERRRRTTRRSRPAPTDGRNVVLSVTCEGQSETKSVEANLGHSIGELRAKAAELFNAPSNYGIYVGETFLNKAQYEKLNDNDTIHLAPRKEA